MQEIQSKGDKAMKPKYYFRWTGWFMSEFAYRFWMGKKRSLGPKMTSEEHEQWFKVKEKRK